MRCKEKWGRLLVRLLKERGCGIVHVRFIWHELLTTRWRGETVRFGHKPVRGCPEPWRWLLGVYWWSEIREHLIYSLLVRRPDGCVDSSNSHPCSASSRPLWWCSNAPSMFPNSVKAFPIEVCRFPKTSFLFGNSFSDHPCTVFSTSSAFFRPPFAFPDVNSTLINIQLRILKYNKNQLWVQDEVWLTFINVF